MSRLIVNGGRTVRGELQIQGAKNSALPILISTLLCDSPSVIHNCPELSDVEASCSILRYLGCEVKKDGEDIEIDPQYADKFDIPDKLMREMRSSIVFLGAICSKLGRARISFPGGCELGPRPIDLHLSALRQLGVIIEEDHGWLNCHTFGKLHGTSIVLSFPSVGATENILLASVNAVGTTIIVNAAREPEIMDLANFLCQCGAKIKGAGESVITIEGVESLHGCDYSVMPDRIVAATYMAAAAITGGELTLKGVSVSHLNPVIPVFKEAGCVIETEGDILKIKRPGKLYPVKNIRTMPYPGFPTDAQAPVMAMASVASGTSIFIENIFENRYKHASELIRLGAKIKIEGKVAIVEGVKKLFGAPVESTDLRGGAALVVAALAAEGQTTITGLRHIDRGYSSIEKQLEKVGADIKRI
ncbi:MAG TPA: UDP-N-acetylglucosamine 1-carboxyvinyltransferase [Ruminiclostridium sp.]|nr:UDP-N-acetylglucosamine 1-carboxyvinyltransferase [Ruminiclostridium sp.]